VAGRLYAIGTIGFGLTGTFLASMLLIPLPWAPGPLRSIRTPLVVALGLVVPRTGRTVVRFGGHSSAAVKFARF